MSNPNLRTDMEATLFGSKTKENHNAYAIAWRGIIKGVPFAFSLKVFLTSPPTLLTLFIVVEYLIFIVDNCPEEEVTGCFLGPRVLTTVSDITALKNIEVMKLPNEGYLGPVVGEQRTTYENYKELLRGCKAQIIQLTDYKKRQEEEHQLLTQLMDSCQNHVTLSWAKQYWNGGLPTDEVINNIHTTMYSQHRLTQLRHHIPICLRAVLEGSYFVDPAFRFVWTFADHEFSVVYAVRSDNVVIAPEVRLRAIRKILRLFCLGNDDIVCTEVWNIPKVDREKLLTHIQTTDPKTVPFKGNHGDIGKVTIV